MKTDTKRWLVAAVPPASMLLAEAYIAPYDGYGALAAAPVLMVPAILSLALGIPATVRLIFMGKDETRTSGSILRLALALSPVAWLMIRRLVV